jgi:hypothetical protein
MRLSGASLLQSLPNKDFRTVASGAQHGFVENRNNSPWQGHSRQIVRELIDAAGAGILVGIGIGVLL